MARHCLVAVVRCEPFDGEREVTQLLEGCAAGGLVEVLSFGDAWFASAEVGGTSDLRVRVREAASDRALILKCGDGLSLDPTHELGWLSAPHRPTATGGLHSRRFVALGWEPRGRELRVARDPLGMEVVYYASLNGGGLAIASRVRALVQLSSVSWEFDIESCAETMLGIPKRAGATFVSQVKELPRASVLVHCGKSTRITKYWGVAGQTRRNAFEQAHDQLRWDLTRSIQKSTSEATRVGVTLSGGLDSTSIFRICVTQNPGNITPINAIFPGLREANEDEYFEMAIRGTDCAPVRFEPRAHVSLVDIVAAADDPFWIPLSSIALGIATTARNVGVDRLLTGTFGDFIGGACRFPVAWLFAHRRWREGVGAAVILGGSPVRVVGRILRQMTEAQAPWMLAKRGAYWRHAFRWLRVLPRGLRARFDLDGRLRRAAADSTGIRLGPEEEVEHFFDDRFTARACGIWRLCERISGVSVEHPFADPSLAVLKGTMGFEDHWSNGYSRMALRKAMSGVIPQEIERRRTKSRVGAAHVAYFRNIVEFAERDLGCRGLGVIRDSLEISRSSENMLLADRATVSVYSLAVAKLIDTWFRMNIVNSGAPKPH